MKAKTLLQVVLPAFAVASTSAFAQDADRGLYLGLSFGQTQVNFADNSVPVAGATASSLSKDESDTGFKLFAGYRFHRHIAVEGGYVDLGEFRVTRNVTAPATGSLSAQVESSGFYADIVGILPLEQFAIFGKFGAMYATTKASLSRTGAVVFAAGANTSPKESEMEWKFGIGASYSFTKNMALRAEVELYKDVGGDQTGEGDIRMISLGLTYRF